MILAKHISDLLYKHNCVIVPDLGGFVGNEISAKIDPVKNKFEPPSKEISFNQNLTKGDGLLVNEVAESTDRSYEEAEEMVQSLVAEIKEQLATSKSYTFQEIGKLFYDANNKLRFEPSNERNYSLNAYGLNTFHVAPIMRENTVAVTEQVVKKPEPQKVTKIVPIDPVLHTQEPSPQRTTWKRIAIAAAILPFVFYIGWLSFATELFRGANFGYADLNPFSVKICPVFKLREAVRLTKDEPITSVFDLDKIGNTVSFSLFDKAEKYFDPNKMITVDLMGNKLAVAESTSVKEVNVKGAIYKYHIIAGCFGVYRNADRLAAKLRKKGFSSAIIDRKNGLYRVAFQSYTSAKEAEEALVGIKANHNKKAWLLEI